MKINIQDPKFKKEQIAEFKPHVLKQPISVEIINVILIMNIDTGEFEYKYDVESVVDSNWTWDGLRESDLK